jgi:hypothetical protein
MSEVPQRNRDRRSVRRIQSSLMRPRTRIPWRLIMDAWGSGANLRRLLLQHCYTI